MATVSLNYICDLNQAVNVQYVNGNVFSGDNGGNTINVYVMDGGQPATIDGTISAYVIRADGATVAVPGSLDGNRAYVTLPQACYAIPGPISIVIKITLNGAVTTICAIVANVYRSSTDSVVDPGEIIPDINALIAEIEQVASSIPPDYTSFGIELKFFEQDAQPINEIYSADLESGYYSTSTGEKMASSSFIRTKILYPISSGVYYSGTGEQVRGCLFDKDKNFIGSIYFNSKQSLAHTYIPENAKYCGIFFSSSNTQTGYVQLIRFTGSQYDCIEYPFDGDYLYIPGAWIQGNGSIASAENMSLVGIMDVKPGDKYYVSNDATYNCICKNASGNVISVTPTSIPPYGKMIIVPEGTVLLYFNLYANVTYDNKMTNYISRVTKGKVLCIGDSVTWLDGRGDYGGTSHMVGYQGTLRKAGYEVYTAGFSGYPYTEGCHEQETEQVKYSIYNEIVNKAYDVSGFDIVILAGGLNDMLYSAPIGNRSDDYSNRVFDSETFNGAISGIINYIRVNNPTAKIIICTTTKSEALTRVWTRASAYNAEIEYNSIFWSAKLCDLFRNMNVQPTYDNFDEYFYDSTHPNNDGMKLIGGQLLLAMAGY